MAKNIAGELVLLFLLCICAWQDMKKRKVLIWPILACGGLGVIYQLLLWADASKTAGTEAALSAADFLSLSAGLIPGAALLLAGKWSRGQIGAGDGLLVMVMGIYLGLWETTGILFYASVAAGMAGLFLMLVLKKNRRYEIPFIPFLLVVFVIRLITENG